MTRRIRFELVLILFFAALWLGPLILEIDGFPFYRDAEYSDLLISHWPNAYFLRQSLHKWGQIPLWNPTILGGAPFAADPLSGLWYPPNWLSFVVPISMAFNVIFWLHLAWAGWGTWLLARAEGVGGIGGLMAALAFSGTSKFIAHIGLGHLGLVSAVSWTPWILVLINRSVDEFYSKRDGWFRWPALAGVALGALTLADPRWTLPAVIVSLVYGIYYTAYSHKHSGDSNTRYILRQILIAAVIFGISALAIAACLILPLFEFVQLSTRTNISITDQTQLQLPIAHILDLILPLITQPEWVAYIGVTVLALAIVALISRTPRSGFWAAIVVSAWILALGDQTPFFSLFTTIIPGADLLRVPARMLFLAAFGIAMLCGKGADWLLSDEQDDDHTIVKRVRLSTIGIAFAVLVLICGLWFYTGSLPTVLIGTGVFTLLIVIWILLRFRFHIPQKYRALVWLVLIAGDLLWVNTQILDVRSQDVLLRERMATAENIADAPQDGRIFSPSYSLPYQTAVQAGLEMVDGINPLQLVMVRNFVADAIGFSPEEYSVTLPPFPNADPNQPWDIEIDALKLGQLNVAYIISEYPVESIDVTLIEKDQGVYLYQNELARPRAWIQDSQDLSDPEWQAVDSIVWTPNQITIIVEGPGILVLSEVAYPGWKVAIDGTNVELHALDGLFRSVNLSPGVHEVVFCFQPRTVYLGSVITLITLLALIGIWIRR
ncbi:MAG: YfhO family protein [Anaerolineaceae bacterium]|nr:MAG: YfhO family protein [Anaerolineaceae bacterium]